MNARGHRRLAVTAALAPALAGFVVRAQCVWQEASSPSGLTVEIPYLQPIAFEHPGGRLLFLKYTNSPDLETWGWDRTAWRLLSTTGPTGRYGENIAADTARGVVVFFGGGADTWEWDGASWTRRNGPGPSSRSYEALVYDSVRGVTVLFGGDSTAGIAQGDTWEYSAGVWALRATAGPPARDQPAAAFDASRGVTVMFGGSAPGVGYLSDTWEWNGAAWTPGAASGPSARSNSAMIYDPVNRRCVLYGGHNNGPATDDAWTYDGTRWAPLSAGTPPQATSTEMAWDESARQGVLLQPDGGFYETSMWTYNPSGSAAPPLILGQPRPRVAQVGQAVSMSVTALGCPILRYQWMHDGAAVANSERVSGVTLPTLLIEPLRSSDAGSYSVVVSGPFGSTASDPAALSIDPCYANCDASTTPPVLNVLDMLCFLTRFAQADAYANCDGSTLPPVLNVNDFVCFLRQFADGCS